VIAISSQTILLGKSVSKEQTASIPFVLTRSIITANTALGSNLSLNQTILAGTSLTFTPAFSNSVALKLPESSCWIQHGAPEQISFASIPVASSQQFPEDASIRMH